MQHIDPPSHRNAYFKKRFNYVNVVIFSAMIFIMERIYQFKLYTNARLHCNQHDKYKCIIKLPPPWHISNGYRGQTILPFLSQQPDISIMFMSYLSSENILEYLYCSSFGKWLLLLPILAMAFTATHFSNGFASTHFSNGFASTHFGNVFTAI